MYHSDHRVTEKYHSVERNKREHHNGIITYELIDTPL